MSGGNLVGLATSILTLVGVIANAWLQRTTQKKLDVNTKITEQVRVSTDGLTEKLVSATGAAKLAQGQLEGRETGAMEERERLAQSLTARRRQLDDEQTAIRERAKIAAQSILDLAAAEAAALVAEGKPREVIVVNSSEDAVPVAEVPVKTKRRSSK